MQDDPTPVGIRLKSESFDAVGRSLPDRFADLGWMTTDQLTGTGYAPAAVLEAGGTTQLIDEGLRREYLHAEEVRPQTDCDRAIETYPSDVSARNQRATFELNELSYSAAVADFSAAIAVEPDSTSARYGRAQAWYRLANYASALDDANVAAASNAGDAYLLRALIHEGLGNDDLATADAASALGQYRSNSGDESTALYVLGTAYLDLGYYAAAIDEFDSVLKRNSLHASALAGRGAAFFAKGDDAKASADFTAASRQAGGQRAYLNLALLEFSRGDASSALTNASRAAQLDPQDPYAELWTLIASRSLHRPLRLAGTTAGMAAWPAPVIRVYLGKAPVDTLDAATASSDAFTTRLHLCEARFYSGIYYLQNGDGSRGRELLRRASAECPAREMERATASAMLRVP